MPIVYLRFYLRINSNYIPLLLIYYVPEKMLFYEGIVDYLLHNYYYIQCVTSLHDYHIASIFCQVKLSIFCFRIVRKEL